MANTKSAAKRARQTVKRSLRNRSVVTHVRSMQKTVRSTQTPGSDQVRALISAIDKAAKRRIIHPNAANRRKARLGKALAGAQSSVAASLVQVLADVFATRARDASHEARLQQMPIAYPAGRIDSC